MRKTSLLYLIGLFFLIVIAVYAASALAPATSPAKDIFELPELDEITREDILAERYWTMVDRDGREIMTTGRRIHVGDEYITSDNKLYRVYRVRGRKAYARYIRPVGAVFEPQSQGLFVFLRNRILPAQNTRTEEEDLTPETAPKRLIGIYHTHNAESYVPTDGTDSINGRGGIHDVGTSFVKAMDDKGIRVIHDQTLHLPHDRGAYRRSRPTTLRLMGKGPDAVFDIHRDATPRHVYAKEIDGEWVTQVQLVVGRQNVNMRANRQFALDLKNTADEVQPGIVKGIFMARGHYNQDLSPLNILIEVGSHTNSREAAEDGVALFTDVVAAYFYGPGILEEGEAPEEQQRAAEAPRGQAPGARAARGNRIAFGTAISLLFLTSLALIGFLLLNTGRWQNLVRDIKNYFRPWLEKINGFLARGDRFLLPWREKLYDISAPVRKFLGPWLSGVAAAVRPYIQDFFAKARGILAPLLEKGDSFLIPLQGKIHVLAVEAWRFLYQLLLRADRMLAVWRDAIHAFSLDAGDNTAVLLARGDVYLDSWRAKIRELALLLKERMLLIYNDLRNRRTLK